MRMAGLPAKVNDKSLETLRDVLVEAFERGEDPTSIAKRMHPKDKRARKIARSKLWNMAGQDEVLQQHIVSRARTRMLVGLGPASRNLVKRASSNRDIQAVKLLFETTGLHNPRVQHEHSGDVNITVSIPRPTFDADGAVTDAEVVEED